MGIPAERGLAALLAVEDAQAARLVFVSEEQPAAELAAIIMLKEKV